MHWWERGCLRRTKDWRWLHIWPEHLFDEGGRDLRLLIIVTQGRGQLSRWAAQVGGHRDGRWDHDIPWCTRNQG